MIIIIISAVRHRTFNKFLRCSSKCFFLIKFACHCIFIRFSPSNEVQYRPQNGWLRRIRLPSRIVPYAQSVDRHRRSGHRQQCRSQIHLGCVSQPSRPREPGRFELLPSHVRVQVPRVERKGKHIRQHRHPDTDP